MTLDQATRHCPLSFSLSLSLSLSFFHHLNPFTFTFIIFTMAPALSESLQKVVNMDGSANQNPKLADLTKNTTDFDVSKEKMSTDWGSKVSDTDHWLALSTDDRYGPSLLEDGHAREKVGHASSSDVESQR